MRTAVVTAHHDWQLQDTFLLQSIYYCHVLLSCALPRCNLFFSMKQALLQKNGSYCIRSWILKSLFLVKLLQEKILLCQPSVHWWLVSLLDFIWMSLSLIMCPSATNLMGRKRQSLLGRNTKIKTIEFFLWDTTYSPTVWRSILQQVTIKYDFTETY